MNKNRKKVIEKIIEQVENLKEAYPLYNLKVPEDVTNLKSELVSLISEIQIPLDEEEEYFDNMPEGLVNSQRGETSEAALANMEEAIDILTDLGLELLEPENEFETKLDEVIMYLQEIVDGE